MKCTLLRLVVAQLVVLMLVPPLAQAQAVPTIELRQGLVITKSARLSPKKYRLPATTAGDSSVITIRGDNITLDFAGATMEGAPPDADPDIATGVAIRIEGGRNVRITNARIRGYKIGILARGTRGLSLIDNNLSNNWKPRLYSIVEHESLIDWLSFHHNEKDEWLRYGAGIYLADVRGGEIRGNTVEQGMNGLMLVRSNGIRITSNSFSFNSGVGIGLYRSNGDTIRHNHVDYNVRGYSEGFYRRGQDAAGLLIYEQSSHNVVAYNSMTHSGDGVFLWAGQSTMDTGHGGANDNLFYSNDFSFAPANGIEATFSRNTFIANRIEGCEYGLWGGYSFSSNIFGNTFVGNRTGIAIEHGQDNVISSNLFLHDSTAIRVWGDPIQPSDWGYPKHRDTESRGYRIAKNLFNANRVGLRVSRTTQLALRDNTFSSVDSTMVSGDSSNHEVRADSLTESESYRIVVDFSKMASVPWLRGGYIPDAGATASPTQRPRSAIVVDEWGPYDWRSPKLWPIDSTRALPLRLRVLGPTGRWRVVSQRGLATVTPKSGRALDTVVVTPKRDSIGNWEIVLEYIGGATLSPRGERKSAGVPYRFTYSRFEPAIDWSMRYFKWNDTTSDIRKNAPSQTAFASLTQVLAQHSPRVDLEGYRAFNPQVPREYFAAEATGSVDLSPGEYTLRTISDDGVRVWVDGALVIDNWKPHESALDFAPLRGGHHDLRLQYYQADGWYEVRLDIIRRRD